jgi:hypothetical protein
MSWRKAICIVSVVACLFISSSAIFADEEEADITNQLVTEENNKGLLMFTIPINGLDTEFDNWLETRNYVRAHAVTENPLGFTEDVTGQDNQIVGDSGFRFYIPTSLAEEPDGRHAFVGFASMYSLKKDVIGAERFDALVAAAQQLYDNGEGVGTWTTPFDPFFLNQYGLQVFMRFQDGKVRNVTEGGVLMLTIDLSNSANGEVLFGFGAIAIDKDATDDSWHESERKPFPGENLTLSFIYDGIADGNIDVTWWIADLTDNEDEGSSGGCHTATFPSLFLFCAATLLYRKFGK